MPETKPFVSKSFASLRGLHEPGFRRHDLHNGADWFNTWRHAAVYKRRKYIKMLKMMIVVALSLTCVFNLKLLVDAKLKYELHKSMYSFELDDNAYFHNNINKPDPPVINLIQVKVTSSKEMVELKINNKVVYDDHQSNEGRGIHVFVLNQATGQIINNEIFDTFVQGQDELMIQYLKSIDDEHRLLAFAVKDEASLNLGRKAKIHLETLGSNLIGSLGWRGTWVMLCYNNGRLIDETIRKTPDVNKWAEPSVVASQIQPQQLTDYSTCEWIASKEENDRRRNFCSKYEGYGGLCRCDRPHDLYIQARNIPNNRIHNVPVAVIASNRPQYLYRMLMTLLNADGVNKDKIIVFIDGHFVETMEVARLLGVRGIYHTPAGVKAARISQHYKSSLSAIFELNPDSDYAIIIEEDLDIAPDFFSYFNQLLPVFESDESIYCLSAWNDQGYQHSSEDPSLLYRVESMPGLGWMLRRSLFKNELEPNWPGPEKQWDWDMWMRHPEVRKGRECIIPDVSRTFHFGTKGVNMNGYFHQLYFSKHRISSQRDVELKNISQLSHSRYEVLMHKLVMKSTILDHTVSPCDHNFVSTSAPSDQSYVAFFKMEDSSQITDFLAILKCLKLWDLDARGLHKSTFRTFINHRHVVFVGYPASPYSLYKPVDLQLLQVTENDKHS